MDKLGHLHDVTNPATGEMRQVTQAEWKNRATDPTLVGFERDPDDETLED